MTQTKSLKNKIYQNYGHKDKQKIWIVLYVKVNSESREFHRWMHLNMRALMKHTHSYTHLPSLHSLCREGRRKEGHTPQNISLHQKNLRPNGDMETTKRENLRKLFFPGLFS